jgi:hypothetical protein
MSILKVLFILTMMLSSSMAQAIDLQFKAKGEVYYRGIIKVYDASLYVDDVARQNNLLAAQTARCLKLDYAVGLDKGKFAQAGDVVLKRQHDEQVLTAIQSQLSTLNQAYQDVKKGDTYWMCYWPEQQMTELRLNDESLLKLNNSATFAEIYMGMWLAPNKPISGKLQKKLLNSLPK